MKDWERKNSRVKAILLPILLISRAGEKEKLVRACKDQYSSPFRFQGGSYVRDSSFPPAPAVRTVVCGDFAFAIHEFLPRIRYFPSRFLPLLPFIGDRKKTGTRVKS